MGTETFVVVSSDAVEAERLARALRDRGWRVETETESESAACERIGQCSPAGIVISLEFEPGQACDLACALSVATATHSIPLVFVGGGLEETAAARAARPDAMFISHHELPYTAKRLTLQQ